MGRQAARYTMVPLDDREDSYGGDPFFAGVQVKGCPPSIIGSPHSLFNHILRGPKQLGSKKGPRSTALSLQRIKDTYLARLNNKKVKE